MEPYQTKLGQMSLGEKSVATSKSLQTEEILFASKTPGAILKIARMKN